MVWSTPRTWVAEEIVTAAIMNTHVKDQFTFLGVSHDHSGDAGDGATVIGGSLTSVRKTIFVYPGDNAGTASASATILDHFAWALADALQENVSFTFRCPSDFTSISKVAVIYGAQATGNIQREIAVSFGAVAEKYNNNTATIAAGIVAVSVLQTFAEDDLTTPLSGLAAGDTVGVSYERDGGNAADTITDTVHIFGIIFEYLGTGS